MPGGTGPELCPKTRSAQAGKELARSEKAQHNWEYGSRAATLEALAAAVGAAMKAGPTTAAVAATA